MRIASLLPAATEMVCALGRKADLVGISHECDFPGGWGNLPKLTRARQKMPESSAAIDQTVRESLKTALSLYEVDVERLAKVKPDIVITQDLCHVCAVSVDDVRAALRELSHQGTQLLSLKPAVLADIWGDIRRVADAIGVPEAGEALAAALQERAKTISQRAAALSSRPRVLSIEWLDPVMVGGLWMPEMIEMAGGTPLVTKPGDPAPTLTSEELTALDPEVVLIKPCGFGLDRAIQEIALLPRVLPWKSWKAVRKGRVFVADGNAFFNRPGPRIVESLEILAACAHLQEFGDWSLRHSDSVCRIDADLHRRSFGR